MYSTLALFLSSYSTFLTIAVADNCYLDSGMLTRCAICYTIFLMHSIGFAIAKRVVQEGGSVSISSRKLPGVEKALAELRALAPDAPARVFGRACHVLDKGQREATVKEVCRRLRMCAWPVAVSSALPHAFVAPPCRLWTNSARSTSSSRMRPPTPLWTRFSRCTIGKFVHTV